MLQGTTHMPTSTQVVDDPQTPITLSWGGRYHPSNKEHLEKERRENTRRTRPCRAASWTSADPPGGELEEDRAVDDVISGQLAGNELVHRARREKAVYLPPSGRLQMMPFGLAERGLRELLPQQAGQWCLNVVEGCHQRGAAVQPFVVKAASSEQHQTRGESACRAAERNDAKHGARQ